MQCRSEGSGLAVRCRPQLLYTRFIILIMVTGCGVGRTLPPMVMNLYVFGAVFGFHLDVKRELSRRLQH